MKRALGLREGELMATGTAKKKPAAKSGNSARTARSKPDPAALIGDAARDLEHEIAASLRAELKSLRKTFLTIQQDTHKAIGRIEVALDPKKAVKRPPARKTASLKTTKAAKATKKSA